MQLGNEFVTALAQIEEEKGLPSELVASSIEAAMVSAYKKFRPGSQDVAVHIDLQTGDLVVHERYKIVEQLRVPDAEWTLEEAQENGYPDLKIGDVAEVEINPEEFTRIAAQTARQVIIQRIKDAERQVVFDEYADHIGEMVVGTVFKAEGDQMVIKINERTEALLLKEEKIPGETYELGDRKKFYLVDVRKTGRGSRIVVSRSHPNLLKNLLKMEVPEIKDGVVEIHNIVREAGTRAKVAVSAFDPNVDPVGACVGNGGTRIKNISDELMGERVDVIIWSSDPMQYVRNALSPAKIIKIEPILDQESSFRVYVRQNQLSLAIGKSGQNVRLAARLTGCKIDIKVSEPERLPTMQDLFEDVIRVRNEEHNGDMPEGQ